MPKATAQVNCMNCQYAELMAAQRGQPMDFTKKICTFNPPSAGMVLTQNGPLSYQSYPIVDGTSVICHKHPGYAKPTPLLVDEGGRTDG